jgi:hypothetical protein
MFIDKEKTRYVLWFTETKSLVSVQRKFINESRRKPSHVNNNSCWFEQFKETRSVGKRKLMGDLQLQKPEFNCSCFFSSGGYIKKTVYAKKNKREVTLEGKNLRSY